MLGESIREGRRFSVLTAIKEDGKASAVSIDGEREGLEVAWSASAGAPCRYEQFFGRWLQGL
jgi:hypothetical protein